MKIDRERCPSCGRRSLKPRVRTKDFRCKECSEIYSPRHFEAREALLGLLIDIEAIFGPILHDFSEPIEPEPVRPPQKEPDKSNLPGCLILAIGWPAAGYGIFQLTDGWESLAVRISCAAIGSLVCAVVLALIVSSLTSESKPEKADVSQEPPPNEWRSANLELAEFKERSKVYYACRSNPEIGVPEPWVATFNISPDGLKVECPPPRELTAEDRRKSLSLAYDNFPPNMIQAVIQGNLHPEAVEALLEQQKAIPSRKVTLADLRNLTFVSFAERNGKHFPLVSAADVDLARRVVARYAPEKADELESIFAVFLPLIDSGDTSVLGVGEKTSTSGTAAEPDA